jgi:hypothetical protein
VGAGLEQEGIAFQLYRGVRESANVTRFYSEAAMTVGVRDISEPRLSTDEVAGRGRTSVDEVAVGLLEQADGLVVVARGLGHEDLDVLLVNLGVGRLRRRLGRLVGDEVLELRDPARARRGHIKVS